jgi:FolB domain-containing protein
MKEDKIFIKDLLLRGIIGINEWEREKEQDIVINVVMTYDTTKSAETDNIDYTLNYRSVCKQIIDLVENSSYFLVERLADEIAKICIVENDAKEVLVRVEKPQALRFADSVGIEIIRTLNDYSAL